MAPLSVDRNDRGAVLVFPEIDASALATRVHDFFLAKGYTLESGKPGAGSYGIGSTASRVLFGGLAKRHKFDVAIVQEGSKVKLQLTKAMSGASGGLIGWKAMNTEFDRIVNAFREDFAFADRLQQLPKVPAAITEEDKKCMKQCQSCHAWNPIAAEACGKCGAKLC
jgi:ribosomal protein L40E